MANFITEDMIEQAILKKLGGPAFGYDIVVCDASPDKKEELNDKIQVKHFAQPRSIVNSP